MCTQAGKCVLIHKEVTDDLDMEGKKHKGQNYQGRDSDPHLLVLTVPVSTSAPSLHFFLRAAPVAYEGSQPRGRIGDRAASLCPSHSHLGSKPHLQTTPQLTAVPDP